MTDPTSLQNLHDIVTPAPTPWLPPAPGWYAVGFSLLLLFCWVAVQKYLRWRRNTYRREALTELSELAGQMEDSAAYGQVLPQLPQLVKRTAIAAYGRSMVASLSGDDWLEFLDKTGSTQVFSQGSGKLLNDCSYLPAVQLAEFSHEQVTGLQKAVLHWTRKHRFEAVAY